VSEETKKYKLTLRGGPVEINEAELDADTARQVVEIVMGGEPTSTAPSRARSATKRRRSSKAKGEAKGSRRRRVKSPGVVSDLKLRPSGKMAFPDFATEKSPNSHAERQAVIVYWLRREANVAAVTIAHVNTCYEGVNWRRPTRLENSLQVTASTKHWLDTSDMANIQLTVPGEEFVRHELPRTKKG
jgi:hypothetical protein